MELRPDSEDRHILLRAAGVEPDAVGLAGVSGPGRVLGKAG